MTAFLMGLIPSEGPLSSTDTGWSNVKALQRDEAVIGCVVQGHSDAPAARLPFFVVSSAVYGRGGRGGGGGESFHGSESRVSSCCF